MKKFLLFLPLLFLLTIPLKSFALTTYTTTEVAKHNTATSCWMIYSNGVYDITKFLPNHNQYLDIRSWCGKDMTQDFKTKAGTGSDHKRNTYSLLATFKIGEIAATTTQTPSQPTTTTTTTVPATEEDDTNETTTTTTTATTTTTTNTDIKSKNPYNILVPALASIILYWFCWYMAFKSKSIKWFNVRNFNGIWNTLLLSSILIPSFGFGMFMILRYQFPDLWGINFNFMYWHVEFSIFMGFSAINHFIQRFAIYKTQIHR